MKTLLLLIVLTVSAVAQTATVNSTNSATYPKTWTQGVPVHLRWGPIPPTTGWTLIDYCVGWSFVSGQEHAASTTGGIVYKGCGVHAAGLSYDVFPFLGQQFYVIWAELLSTDGTKVALSADSNEARCDLEVLSETATDTTFYCKDQTDTTNPPAPPTGLTAVSQ